MKLTFLGTGTSIGVPMIGCRCEVCMSKDARDKRLRTSALLETSSGANILLDCGPDFRYQMLRLDSPSLAAALLTHTHYDHVGGVDDLRPYCYTAPDGHFPLYCRPDVAQDLRERVPYCFARDPYPGVPTFTLHEIREGDKFYIPGIAEEISVIGVMHGKLHILGFRIADFAYITDCSSLSEESLEALMGVRTIVVNALRIEPHPSHMSLDEALALIDKISPATAYLTHLSHGMGLYRDVVPTLPPNVKIAIDFQTVEV